MIMQSMTFEEWNKARPFGDRPPFVISIDFALAYGQFSLQEIAELEKGNIVYPEKIGFWCIAS